MKMPSQCYIRRRASSFFFAFSLTIVDASVPFHNVPRSLFDPFPKKYPESLRPEPPSNGLFFVASVFSWLSLVIFIEMFTIFFSRVAFISVICSCIITISMCKLFRRPWPMLSDLDSASVHLHSSDVVDKR